MESILTSSRPVIVCDYNGKFEFSSTTAVSVNGVDFIGCFVICEIVTGILDELGEGEAMICIIQELTGSNVVYFTMGNR